MSQGFWLAPRLAASEPWELSPELGRKQTVLGLKRKGMGFSFQAISNWEALVENNSLTHMFGITFLGSGLNKSTILKLPGSVS